MAVSNNAANVTLDRCLVIANSTPNFGGGLQINSGVLVGENSTVTGNTADQGGGLAALTGSTLAIVFSTVSNNYAFTVSNGLQIAAHASASVILESSIIDNRELAGAACFSSSIGSTGHNIESPGNTCNLSETGDMPNVTQSSLALGPLADNGRPLTASRSAPPALPSTSGGTGDCPPVDQRGGPRVDGFCDIGSYELGAQPPILIFRDSFESGDTSKW